jgi:hypothetical protein
MTDRTKRHLVLLLAVLIMAGAAAAVDDTAKCAVCGEPIAKQSRFYRTQDGRETYCEHCFLTAPRCPRCGRPTAPAAIDPASGVCTRCVAKLPRCTACGKVITDTVYTFPPSPGQFCGNCKRDRPACYVCGVPVGDTHWRYPDGRHVCNLCGERAVFDVAEIGRIMQDTEKLIRRRLNLVVRQPYELRVDKLADSQARDSRLKASEPASGGLYGKELGIYRRVGGRSEIVLLFGLPPELIYEAAAHEYAHAWAAENCRPDLPLELSEGFAQWVAADVLRSMGFRVALEKLESRTDAPYGTGYRRVRSMTRTQLWTAIGRNG